MYKNVILPLFLRMDAEFSHNLAAFSLRTAAKIPPLNYAIHKRFDVNSPRLSQNLLGLCFANPLGLAAGMTKSGRELLGWEIFGFGFLEMGGITKDEQRGNEGTRMFRNIGARVLFNRMGFNNPGADKTARFLARTRPPNCPLFINIGKSKNTPNALAAEDYAYTFKMLYRYGDIFVVNVSSPNTLRLRDLQGKEFLKGIFGKTSEVRKRSVEEGLGYKKVLVKLSPDLSSEELKHALEAIAEGGADGIIATNTTTTKRGVLCPTMETVGMSGPPLFELALPMVAEIHRELPELPLIGVGGIDSGKKAYDMIRAGAHLIQILTGLVYEGPALVSKIQLELNDILTLNAEYIWSFSPKVKRS